MQFITELYQHDQNPHSNHTNPCIHQCLSPQNTPFQKYDDYDTYVSQWAKIVPKAYVHDVSHLGVNSQLCSIHQCRFFYYQSKDESMKDAGYNQTILFVSGFHGNERIGPHTLIHGYKHIKGKHIIYFPMANPSAFIKHQKNTYPSNIDPYLDFPFDNNTKCFQTSASHILDYLYRTYNIALTVVLRNGETHIGFDWGTKSKKKDELTQDHQINMAIAQMLRQVGGQDKHVYLPKFQISTMNQRFYSSRGSFSDWAYGATKHPSLLNSCHNYTYLSYQKNNMNGLVFTIELGPFKFIREDLGTEYGIISEDPLDRHHRGFVSRSIRMFKDLAYVLTPQLLFTRTNGQLAINVKGCKFALVTNLKVKYEHNQTSQVVFQQKKDEFLTVKGDLGAKKSPLLLQLSRKDINKQAQLTYSCKFQCDAQWQGKGQTFFSTKRVYLITNNKHPYTEIISEPIQQRNQTNPSSYVSYKQVKKQPKEEMKGQNKSQVNTTTKDITTKESQKERSDVRFVNNLAIIVLFLLLVLAVIIFALRKYSGRKDNEKQHVNVDNMVSQMKETYQISQANQSAQSQVKLQLQKEAEQM